MVAVTQQRYELPAMQKGDLGAVSALERDPCEFPWSRGISARLPQRRISVLGAVGVRRTRRLRHSIDCRR